MTIYFPDVSNFQRGLEIQPDTVAVFAKATEGTSFRDSAYADFKAQAASVGAEFAAYHFLHQGSAAAQAEFAFSVIGPGVPTMIDFEPYPDINSYPTVADANAFKARFRELGGVAAVNYLPPWYHRQLGSPSLASLADLALVSSAYLTYSDDGPGWESYGGLSPAIWQYTDSLAYGGMNVDFNAFRGSVGDLHALLYGFSPVTAPTSTEEDDMPQQIEPTAVHSAGYMYAFPRGKYREVAFVADTLGAPAAKLRVVIWTPSGPQILDGTAVPTGSHVIAFADPANTYAVSVGRQDAGGFPVGVAFV